MIKTSPKDVTDYSNDFQYIQKKINADYRANESIWATFWSKANIDSRLEAGDTSLMQEQGNVLPGGTQCYFNRVRPLCSMVSGFQRRNRKSTVVVPLERGDQETADQWTKLIMGIYARENVYDTISEAFYQGACVTGLNLLHVYLDFMNDPVSGDLKIESLAYNQYFIDPYWRSLSLADAGFIWRRSYLTHAAAIALMPNQTDEIMNLKGNASGVANDARFNYMPEAQSGTLTNLLAYDEYYYRSYRKQKLLIDRDSGETFELNDEENYDIPFFLETHPEMTIIEQEIPTVRLAVMVQDKVMSDGPQPLGIDRYPFVGVYGYYNSMISNYSDRLQGLCRSLRDPQILLNRRIALSADMLESQVSSGWIFKENALVDVNHLFQSGPARVVPLKSSAQMTDIQPIQPPQIPPSFFELQNTFSKELSLVSGINEELMGFNYDDKSGYRSALQQGAGLTTLQPLFHRLDQSQNQLGELLMEAVRANYTPGKIYNMLGGQEPAALFYNKAFGKYQCKVELGFNTETQRQMQFAQLQQLQEMGYNLPLKTMINAATIQNKNELIKEMEQQEEQAAQAQQAAAQAQIALQQAQTELARAKVASDEGLAAERESRVLSNIGLMQERQMKSERDVEGAVLDRVKALKELQEMDLSQIQRVLEIARLMREDVEKDIPQQQSGSAGLDRGVNLADRLTMAGGSF